MKRFISILSAIIVLISLLSVKSFALDEDDISAFSCVLMFSDGRVIFDKNSHEKLPMASTTKIMTSLIVLETADLSQKITVTDDMLYVEGTSMGLRSGDTVNYYSLLCGMLLSSGNDAANAAVELSRQGKPVNISTLKHALAGAEVIRD